MTLTIPLNRINLDKQSVVFTWDDNSCRHATIIAPLFTKYNFRCTFYIIPGALDFNKFTSGYFDLASKNFEIGSHSYSHRHMTKITNSEADFEFRQSKEDIYKCTKKYPITFAFPHHDENPLLISKSSQYYIETRNNLYNSKRISFKSKSSFESLYEKFESALQDNYNIIFSGHSVIKDSKNLPLNNIEGYEPIKIDVLVLLLNHLKNQTKEIEVITFAQASLKEFIRSNKLFNGVECKFTDESLAYLEKLNIDVNFLRLLL